MADSRLNLSRADAAQARALKVRDLSDRPSDRMASRESGAPRGWVPAARAQCSIERAAAGGSTAGTVRFEGLASVTGQFYDMWDWYGPYDEQVQVGAFEQTLARADLSTPLVLSHDSMRRMAETRNTISPLQLSEVTEGATTGLMNVAPSLQLAGKFADPDVAYIVPKLESGLIDEMSFRFMITKGRWSEDFTQYTIMEVDIHRGDTAIVGYGANPLTAGAGLRSQPTLSQSARIALELARADDDRYARLVL